MAGKRYPLQRKADFPADFHVQDGQRNRNAAAALDHIVEVAVARIVVVVRVARKFEVVEQELVKRNDFFLRIRVRRQASAQARRHPFDFAKVPVHVQIPVSIRRHQQARLGKAVTVFLVRKQIGKTIGGGHTYSTPRREKSRSRKPKAARQAA